MGQLHRVVSGFFLAALVGCTVSPNPSQSPAPHALPKATEDTPSPTASAAVQSPAPEAAVAISPDIEVVYTGDNAAMWVSAFTAGGKTGPSGPLAVASATVGFGDGTAGTISQDCGSPAMRLRLTHVYRAAASYTLTVSSAVLCDPGWQPILDAGEGITAFEAAPATPADWPV